MFLATSTIPATVAAAAAVALRRPVLTSPALLTGTSRPLAFACVARAHALARPSQIRPYSSAAAGGTPARAAGEGAYEKLTWQQYLAKRKYRKRAEIAVSIPTTLLGLGLGISYFSSQEIDPTTPIMGLEPIWVVIGATILSGVAGYLVGPGLGAAGWRLYNRRWSKALEEMDRKFYAHIAKNRADPARQALSSSSHPLPDYYGEKIHDLSGYRKWLRAQLKYKRTSI